MYMASPNNDPEITILSQQVDRELAERLTIEGGGLVLADALSHLQDGISSTEAARPYYSERVASEIMTGDTETRTALRALLKLFGSRRDITTERLGIIYLPPKSETGYLPTPPTLPQGRGVLFCAGGILECANKEAKDSDTFTAGTGDMILHRSTNDQLINLRNANPEMAELHITFPRAWSLTLRRHSYAKS